MTLFRYVLPLAIVGSALALWAQSGAVPKPKDEKFPQPASAPQPIPFDHKQHVSLGMECADCHPIKGEGFAAGYPAAAKCMACHAAIKAESPHIAKLAEFEKSGEEIPWVKVYRVPDYVWFSHRYHKEAELACSDCHGAVAESEVVMKEKSTSMAACMACHDKHKAPNACNFCHDPG
jgi:hypothetical protein